MIRAKKENARQTNKRQKQKLSFKIKIYGNICESNYDPDPTPNKICYLKKELHK